VRVSDGLVITLLGRAMDVCTRRASLVASNIANVDTPGYRARTFDFDAVLGSLLPQQDQLLLQRSSARHIQPSVPTEPIRATAENNAPARNDRNDVNVEKELSDLLEAEIMFSALSRLLRNKIGMIKHAISEGR